VKSNVVGTLTFLLALFIYPSITSVGQQERTDSALTDQQKLGQRIFQQRCAVCHTEVAPGAKRYGPVLYKDIVRGNEDMIRDRIRNGSPAKMPGFRYGLEPSEINSIVEYLKVVPKP